MDAVELLTPAKAAEFLGISLRGLYRLQKAGDLPHYRVGKQLRFDPAELRQALMVSKS